MDESRAKDLAHLQAVIDNPLKPYLARYRANKAKQAIIRQMKDRKLCRMRERLIKAAKALDEEAEWKISQEIKYYLRENHMEIPV